MSEVPEPEEIYERTKEEGAKRAAAPAARARLDRVRRRLRRRRGRDRARARRASADRPVRPERARTSAGSIAFGIAFVFLVVGRAELFTENFLVPIAGLDHRSGASWLKPRAPLAPLAALQHPRRRDPDPDPDHARRARRTAPASAIVDASSAIHRNHVLALFMSAVFAGALITA